MFFWTALFMLSIALQYAAAAAPQRALALSGAIYTSNFDGSIINANIYGSKADVYLTGGPCQGGSHLGADDYYFEVTSPNGVLLSSDAIGNRQFSVGSNGFISGTTGTHVTHDVACTAVLGVTLQLLPYDDTNNPGGEYKLTIATASSVEEECEDFDAESTTFEICNGADSKSDNFKVGPNGNITVEKVVTGAPDGFSGSFHVALDCGQEGNFEATIVFPDPGSVTIQDLAEGTECTVEETSVPNPPADYQWLDPVYDPADATVTIVADENVTVTITNPLDFIEKPDVSIVKSVSLSADGPWVDELTVTTGTTVYYRITITNEGNVPLTDVGLSDDVYGALVAACDVPSTLAVGESFDCNYSTSAVSGTTVNTATVITEELPPEDDDATVNASEEPTLTITKTNNAPLDDQDLPSAEEGDTVTFTLAYEHTGDDVAGGLIVDFLPDGLTYVVDSATDSANGEFVFDGYDSATHSLSWVANGDVTEGGSVSYQATVDEGAADLEQPLQNIGCIASDDTDEDCDDSLVYVGAPPLAETSVPTPPQTDIATTESTASSGSLLLVLLALAGIVLAVVFVAPTPASIRRRMDR